MRSAGRWKGLVYAAWGAGLALLVGLVADRGFGEIWAAVLACGWGLPVVVAYHLVPLAADSAGWRSLFAAHERPALGPAMGIRWIGEAVNGLLPVAQVGGELARVRAAMLRGIPGALAGAAVTVDLTLGIASQAVLAAAALAALPVLGPETGAGALVPGLAIGLAAFGLLIAVFLALQNAGLFRPLARVLTRAVRGLERTGLAGGAAALDAAIAAIYRRRRRLATAIAWRAAGWALGAGEVWLALRFLGAPVGLAEAFLLEMLGQALRSAAFLIPGGLGVQDGGLMLLAAALGVPPETGLALALVKRVRELVFGIPGLTAWHRAEGKRLRAG